MHKDAKRLWVLNVIHRSKKHLACRCTCGLACFHLTEGVNCCDGSGVLVTASLTSKNVVFTRCYQWPLKKPTSKSKPNQTKKWKQTEPHSAPPFHRAEGCCWAPWPATKLFVTINREWAPREGAPTTWAHLASQLPGSSAIWAADMA